MQFKRVKVHLHLIVSFVGISLRDLIKHSCLTILSVQVFIVKAANMVKETMLSTRFPNRIKYHQYYIKLERSIGKEYYK